MERAVEQVAATAEVAFRELREGDRVAVMTFHEHSTLLLRLTPDLERATRTVRERVLAGRFEGGTALLAGVDDAARYLMSTGRGRARAGGGDHHGQPGIAEPEGGGGGEPVVGGGRGAARVSNGLARTNGDAVVSADHGAVCDVSGGGDWRGSREDGGRSGGGEERGRGVSGVDPADPDEAGAVLPDAGGSRGEVQED
ncbi:MAG: hypothetical protein M9913_19310 [Bryobacteraceae bacterium]|nr:hypothetical protein [Bryobacteraceae bacterium]